MRLRHIEVLRAILQTGSLTSAAELLHVSQPAASKLLASAEAQLGYKLFDRIKGRLKPTRETLILAPQVARVHQELISLKRLAHNLKHVQQGHLRVGCTPALGLGLVPVAVQRIRQLHPDITFDLHTHHSSELVAALGARELDLVVAFDTEDHSGIKRLAIGETELVLVSLTEHPAPVTLRELASCRLIALDAHDPAGALLQQALDAQGVQPNIVSQVQTHYVACALVQVGFGSAVVDRLTAQAMVKSGMHLSPLEPALRLEINAAVHALDPMSSQHHLLIDTLKAVCKTF